MIGERIGNTLRLAGFTALVAVPLSVVLGLIAAVFAGSFLDRSISTGTLCFVAVPEFFVAAFLVFVLAIKLRWLPPLSLPREGMSFGDTVRTMALPIATLTLAVMAHMTRMTRSAVLSVMSSAYIEQAILKGNSRVRLIVLHALPNAWAPIVNVIALNLAYLVSGVVIVETIFNYPGLAKLMVEGVSYPRHSAGAGARHDLLCDLCRSQPAGRCLRHLGQPETEASEMSDPAPNAGVVEADGGGEDANRYW